MKKLQEIANGVHPSVRLTIDYPSKNQNKRLPILNTEQWIEEVRIGEEVKTQIVHSHYSKPMGNRYVVHHDSALPIKSKINISCRSIDSNENCLNLVFYRRTSTENPKVYESPSVFWVYEERKS